MFIGEQLPFAITAAILLPALLAISTACHRNIYRSRPDPRQLTAFYLAVATGGAVGGLFCALIAPLIFDWTYEYPLLLIAAAATLLPDYSPLVPRQWLERPPAANAIPGLAALMLVAALIAALLWEQNDALVRYGSLAALLVGSLAVGSRLLLTSVMVAGMLIAGAWTKLERSIEPGRMTRTYFGIYSVVDNEGSRQLLHGTTLHGIQLLTQGWERFPTTYYAEESGVGRALRLAPAMFGPRASISIVGLGAGTLACYKQPHQRWTFFELDPAVVDIAERQFTFLARCAPGTRIVIGDARLELAKEPAPAADVLVVDAFSSDAIPLHLLTKEAFAVYGRHLKPNGLLLVHVSNRHLDLEPVVAAAPGWQIRIGRFDVPWDYRQLTTSHWMALSRSPAMIEALAQGSGDSFWQIPSERRLLWTDDHASLLSVIK
jgi:SAM-dependent methyltransferase